MAFLSQKSWFFGFQILDFFHFSASLINWQFKIRWARPFSASLALIIVESSITLISIHYDTSRISLLH